MANEAIRLTDLNTIGSQFELVLPTQGVEKNNTRCSYVVLIVLSLLAVRSPF